MNFLQKLFSSSKPAGHYYRFEIKCQHCGEILEGRVDLYNDPSLEFEGDREFYFCRKVLIGSGPCYRPIEATFKFDENRKLVERQVSGGQFVENGKDTEAKI
jgi:hypothetical protein